MNLFAVYPGLWQALVLITILIVLAILALIRNRGARYFSTYKIRWLAFIGAFYLFGVLGVMGYCLFFCIREIKAAFAVKDTVTSRIASAAQGYVEIIGQGGKDSPIIAPLSGVPCLWYEYAEHKNKSFWPNWMVFDSDDWELVSSGSSKQPFTLSDGSAKCRVDPAGAQMSGLDYTVWFEGKRRYKEILLLAEKDVYVLGEFITKGEELAQAKVNREVAALINTWKQDPTQLKARFDLDNDGEIGPQEMALVRSQAQREVNKHTTVAVEPTHTIGKPNDRRPFIISHHPHHKLAVRHRLHGLFYLLIFLLVASLAPRYDTGLIFGSRFFQKVVLHR
jgi:hypothetical protein